MTHPRQPRRRGHPEETRERLLTAAARELNRVGYLGTDTNRLARAAGYSPALFYRHFPDKRAVLLAAYQRWVSGEWDQIDARIARGGAPAELAACVVGLVVALHRRWRGLRRSLRILAASDPVVRRAYQAQRRRQLDRMGAHDPVSRAQAASVLYLMERAADGLADGEARALGLDPEALEAVLATQVAELIRGRRAAR